MDSLMDGWMYLLGSTVMLFATCPDMSDLLLLQPFPLCVYIYNHNQTWCAFYSPTAATSVLSKDVSSWNGWTDWIYIIFNLRLNGLEWNWVDLDWFGLIFWYLIWLIWFDWLTDSLVGRLIGWLIADSSKVIHSLSNLELHCYISMH